MFEVRLEFEFESRFARHPSDLLTLCACVCKCEYLSDFTITNNGSIGRKAPMCAANVFVH